MRQMHLITLLIVSLVVAIPATSRAARRSQPTRATAGQRGTTQPVAAEEQRKAAAATQAASAEEQKIAQRVRWVETQLQREEQLLTQRLAYANRLRAAGLQKNDEKVLKQAEEYERKALAVFQQRLAQYEKLLPITTGGTSPTSSKKKTSSTSGKSSSAPRARSSAKPHPQSRLIRRR